MTLVFLEMSRALSARGRLRRGNIGLDIWRRRGNASRRGKSSHPPLIKEEEEEEAGMCEVSPCPRYRAIIRSRGYYAGSRRVVTGKLSTLLDIGGNFCSGAAKAAACTESGGAHGMRGAWGSALPARPRCQLEGANERYMPDYAPKYTHGVTLPMSARPQYRRPT